MRWTSRTRDRERSSPKDWRWGWSVVSIRCRAGLALVACSTCVATVATPSRGIKEIHGYASELWRVEPEYAVKLEPALDRVGVLMEPTTVVTKAWEQVEKVGARSWFEPETVLITGAGPIRSGCWLRWSGSSAASTCTCSIRSPADRSPTWSRISVRRTTTAGSRRRRQLRTRTSSSRRPGWVGWCSVRCGRPRRTASSA